MADKPIDQLDSADRISEADSFVLQQSGEAKKLTGQVLIDWLTKKVADNLSDVTATADDIAEGKTAYVAGGKVTGNVATYTDFAPYANASAKGLSDGIRLSQKVSQDSLLRSGTEIRMVSDISNFGDATAADVASGKTFTSSAGLKVTGTHECSAAPADPVLQSKTVTPTESQQTVSPDSGYDGLSSVTVEAIPDSYVQPSGTKQITANGTHDVADYASVEVNVPVEGLDTSEATSPASAGDIAKGKIAFVNGEKVTGTITTYTGAVTFKDSTVDIGSGIYLKQTITKDTLLRTGAEPSFFCDKSNFGDAGKADVLAGKTFTSTAGLKVTGTMPSKAAATYTPGTSDQTIASGQYLSGAQTVKGDSNLVAENIKSGVSIFGVAGTYTGSGGSSGGIQAQRITSASETITISGSGTVKVWGYGYKSAQYAGTTYAFVGDGYYSGSYGTPSKTSATFSISNGTLSGLPAGMTALDVLVTIGVA